MNQIFFNILSNAVKYTQEGGKIIFRMREHITGDAKMAFDCEVIDNGIGMSREFQEILFDPFSQEGRDDNSQSRGSGLGLAIVKKIIDLMGGTIGVDSELGKGTKFTFHFEFDSIRAEDITESDTRFAAENDKILNGKHVLICEDHPLNQQIAKALLEERGMIVEIAENGQSGIKEFMRSSESYYDVILMDIRMPVMDGYEAARAIRKLKRKDAVKVPIIAMTADAFEEDVEKCLEVGMDGHIAKPLDPDSMAEEIAASLSGNGR